MYYFCVLLNFVEKQKCRESWPTLSAEQGFTIFLDVILLILPLILMTVTYSLIIRTLWQAMVISTDETENSGNKTIIFYVYVLRMLSEYIFCSTYKVTIQKGYIYFILELVRTC